MSSSSPSIHPCSVKAERFELMVRGCWKQSLCLRFQRLFALGFYWASVKGCRVVLSRGLCAGCRMCVKGVAQACECDLVLDSRHQACGECMLDSEPSSRSLSFPCRSATPCPDDGPTPAPSAPPGAPLPVGPVTSALARASPEPSCCACTHQVLAESSNQSHSEENNS